MLKFSKGDIVRLKSGGLDMTIAAVLCENAESQSLRFNYIACKAKYGDSPALYICTWFDGKKDKEHIYPEEVLEFGV